MEQDPGLAVTAPKRMRTYVDVLKPEINNGMSPLFVLLQLS